MLKRADVFRFHPGYAFFQILPANVSMLVLFSIVRAPGLVAGGPLEQVVRLIFLCLPES